MPFSVFYSWQSDTPARINRNLIEAALEKAIRKLGKEPAIIESLREDSLVLDKDTKGVPGTPPIVDVIFEKIAKSAVFVPDVTFVGMTEEGRPIPNPNVMIEYGWALRCLGYSRIIPVMNTAFGEASPATLPFNMRHLRFPLSYHLSAGADDDFRRGVREELIGALSDAIGEIIHMGLTEKPEPFPERPFTTDASTFLKEGEPIAIRTYRAGDKPVRVPSGAHLFLRVIPGTRVNPIPTTRDALDLMRTGHLEQMTAAFSSGTSYERNEYGAVAYESWEESGQIYTSGVTQLFLTKEIWGIEAQLVAFSEEELKRRPSFLPSSELEKCFTRALENYLKFSDQSLALPLPLKLVAGATGIKGYRMSAPQGMSFGGAEQLGGHMVQHSVTFEGRIEDYSAPPHELLRPFFERLWKESGLKRPDKEIL